jgi:peptidoglycan/LPS O-acetylase OafA/YrhL
MKLQSIQFLRAMAALLVVYAHSIDLQMKYAISGQQHFFYLQNFGAIGVDIFFVLSGFIISYTSRSDSGLKAGRRFLLRRFIRINPIYYIATLLCFAPNLIHALKTGGSFHFTPDTLLKTIFLLPFADHGQWISPYLGVAWTLGFEWFFYLLFLILILDKTQRKVGWMLLILSVLVLFGLMLREHRQLNDYRLIFMTNPLMLEFALGALISWFFRHMDIKRSIAYLLVLAALGTFAFEIIRGFGEISEAERTLDGTLSARRLLLWGLPSALLVAGCVGLEQCGSLKRLWNNRLAGLAGDASYSIYLTHVTVFLLFDSLYLRSGFFLNPDLAIWLQVAIAAACGILFYKMVEFPLLKALRSRFIPQQGSRSSSRSNPKSRSKLRSRPGSR